MADEQATLGSKLRMLDLKSFQRHFDGYWKVDDPEFSTRLSPGGNATACL